MGRSVREVLQLFTSSIRGLRTERERERESEREKERENGKRGIVPSSARFFFTTLQRETFGCLPRDNFLRYVINVPEPDFNRATSAFYDCKEKGMVPRKGLKLQ